jgi:high-affinity iron transporter
MFTTAIIAFREFLEAFLIVGIFLGISKKLQLKKETEIAIAATIGFVISLLLATLTYVFGDYARGILTEERAEVLESFILIFSGIFIAYVIFSLHNTLRKSRGGTLLKAHKKLEKDAFDFSLFATIILMVVREGFEIALFTSSISLFSVFLQNFIGLLLGFVLASTVGVAAYFSYIRFPIGKVFKITEYMIILLGAAMVQIGITELLEHQFHIELGDMFRFPLQFLPDHHTIFGHLLQTLTGIDSEFSLIRLLIMIVYIVGIYFLFLRKRPVHLAKQPSSE